MFVDGCNEKECLINAFTKREGSIDCSVLNDLWLDLDSCTKK